MAVVTLRLPLRGLSVGTAACLMNTGAARSALPYLSARRDRYCGVFVFNGLWYC